MRIEGKALPEFNSLDQMVEYFDTHDLGDYFEQMPEVSFEINIKKRTHVIALDEDLAKRLTQIARSKRVSSKTLVNRWLREKISEQAKAT